MEESKRVGELVSILAKYGLADGLKLNQVKWINTHLKKHKSNYEFSIEPKNVRIRMALTEMGTTFVKLGQFLSVREDLIGRDLAKELSKLQTKSKEDASGYIHRVLERHHLSDKFSEFKIDPIASASIGQVHVGRLHTGEEVIIKIRHEGIVERVNEDLKILNNFVNLGDRIVPSLKFLNPKRLFIEFEYSLRDELNLNKELSNLLRFRADFKNNKEVVFPIGYEAYSNDEILVMSRVSGFDLNSSKIEKLDIKLKKSLAMSGANMYMDMIFKNNFYHADPHPGNLMITEDHRLGVIDCGMVGRLDNKSKDIIENLIMAFLNEDLDSIKDLILDLGTVPQGIDEEAFGEDIELFINQYLGAKIKDIDINGCIEKATEIIHNYKIVLPSSVSMLMKTLMLLEGTSKVLYTDFDIFEILGSYKNKLIYQKVNPKSLLKSFGKKLFEWERIADQLPKLILKLIKNADQEKFVIKLEHENINSASLVLVKGIIAAALIVGGAMMVSTRIGPLVWDISIIGGMFFIGAMVLFYGAFKQRK
ncbi:MAG: ABC1 kinase family protein [Flavobacteriaceae bacterium]